MTWLPTVLQPRRSRSRGRDVMRRAALLLPVCAVAACADAHVQSPLHVAGEHAGSILTLWRWLLAIVAVVYVVVLALAAWALFRRRGRDTAPRPAAPRVWIGLGGVLVPAVVLTFILLLTMRTLAAESASDAAAADMTVRVVAKQWWWDVYYEHPEPQQRLHTANEIHIPVGRSIRIVLESRDVIHSFWVPALDGKIDMIPGRTNTMVVRAQRTGVFRGQCAEYCGMQHANMAFLVIVRDTADFAAWYTAQLAPAAAPTTPAAAEGQRVFLEKPCAMCHAVRGTLAHATAGPDLTHLASRRTIAAGTLPNNRGNLGGWITNPQALKPGAHMPNIDLSSDELRALLAFLESLR